MPKNLMIRTTKAYVTINKKNIAFVMFYYI